jgi:hypothetical protein
MKMGVDRWCDATDRGKREYWEKNLFRCQFVHQELTYTYLVLNPYFRVDWILITLGSSLYRAVNSVSF